MADYDTVFEVRRPVSACASRTSGGVGGASAAALEDVPEIALGSAVVGSAGGPAYTGNPEASSPSATMTAAIAARPRTPTMTLTMAFLAGHPVRPSAAPSQFLTELLKPHRHGTPRT